VSTGIYPGFCFFPLLLFAVFPEKDKILPEEIMKKSLMEQNN